MPLTQPDTAAPGGAPRVPDGTRVYAIGDIHGRADLLADLQEQILTDARTAGAPRKVLVYLGDYVDRGPESAAVIESLATKPLDGFETVHLKGNHEDFLIAFMETGALGRSWLMNGGTATLKSYGIGTMSLMFGESGFDKVRAKLSKALPDHHRRFLDALSLTHREGDYLFVHAGIRPDVALDDQKDEDLMWIRYEFLRSNEDFGKMIVHGHTPTIAPEVKRNRIGIDTGAYDTGRLTCLVLEGAERRFLATGDG